MGRGFHPLAATPIILTNSLCSDTPIHNNNGSEDSIITCSLNAANANRARKAKIIAIGGTTTSTADVAYSNIIMIIYFFSLYFSSIWSSQPICLCYIYICVKLICRLFYLYITRYVPVQWVVE
jgi:protein-S-isoprenylcysteine O-methyltransferase Ste14